MVWSQNKNQICKRALEIVGVIPFGGEPTLSDYNLAGDCLNATIENMQNDGISLVQIEEVTITLTASDTVLGYRCIKSHVASALNEPGVGTAYKEFWYADSSIVTPAWVLGTSYHSIADMDLGTDTDEVFKAYVNINGSYQPLEVMSLEKYADIPEKYTTGQPIAVYIDYQAIPKMYFHYIPDQAYTIHYWRVKNLLSLDTASQVPMLDSGFYDAMTWDTANQLAYIKQLSESKILLLEKKSKDLMSKARSSQFKFKSDSFVSGAYNY
jgi:hypothetical protein